MIVKELASPLSNGQYIGANHDTRDYLNQPAKRGEPEFVMSRSSLMEFAACPARWLAGYQRKDSDSTDWGSLVDCLLLSPEAFDELYAVRPEDYMHEDGSVRAWCGTSKSCKQWVAKQGGKEVLKQVEHFSALKAVGQIRKSNAGKDILKHAACQVYCTAEYEDSATGLVIPLKVLIDIVPDVAGKYRKALFDFKTAVSAEHRKWTKKVAEYNYHVQAAMELDVYTLATGEDRCEFQHLVQENFSPWQTEVWYLSADFIEIGRAAYIGALKRYARCLAENHWPGYAELAAESQQGFARIEPADWMLKDL